MPTLESRATLGVNITFLILSWIFVSLRVFVRAFMLRAFGGDDWTMVFAQLLFTAYLIAQLGGIAHGTGQHLIDLTPADATTALKFWYFCELFYCCATTVLKVSIGLFLLRVATNRVHIWIVRGVMISAGVFGFAFLFVLVFQCWPISDWWSLDINEKHCIKPDIVVGLTYAVSGLNVIADWTLGILPAFMVKNLQMSVRQKRLVAIILSFAAIGSSATIVRLPYVGSLSQSFDGSEGDFLCKPPPPMRALLSLSPSLGLFLLTLPISHHSGSRHLDNSRNRRGHHSRLHGHLASTLPSHGREAGDGRQQRRRAIRCNASQLVERQSYTARRLCHGLAEAWPDDYHHHRQ